MAIETCILCCYILISTKNKFELLGGSIKHVFTQNNLDSNRQISGRAKSCQLWRIDLRGIDNLNAQRGKDFSQIIEKV